MIVINIFNIKVMTEVCTKQVHRKEHMRRLLQNEIPLKYSPEEQLATCVMSKSCGKQKDLYNYMVSFPQFVLSNELTDLESSHLDGRPKKGLKKVAALHKTKLQAKKPWNDSQFSINAESTPHLPVGQNQLPKADFKQCMDKEQNNSMISLRSHDSSKIKKIVKWNHSSINLINKDQKAGKTNLKQSIQQMQSSSPNSSSRHVQLLTLQVDPSPSLQEKNRCLEEHSKKMQRQNIELKQLNNFLKDELAKSKKTKKEKPGSKTSTSLTSIEAAEDACHHSIGLFERQLESINTLTSNCQSTIKELTKRLQQKQQEINQLENLIDVLQEKLTFDDEDLINIDADKRLLLKVQENGVLRERLSKMRQELEQSKFQEIDYQSKIKTLEIQLDFERVKRVLAS